MAFRYNEPLQNGLLARSRRNSGTRTCSLNYCAPMVAHTVSAWDQFSLQQASVTVEQKLRGNGL